ncbi:hypothetical protein ACFS5N_01005 [Mucilaginibacter ximonensis]|uniref:Uncharacterized protein n=1 Tax=Mucilaginibacter ximonensis TaxID=538021 RepID=A0ABW5Y736_9SPHI
MANHPVKYNRNQKNNHQNQTETWKHNWEVMKPFVRFGFKAMAIIGGALISIIKLVPELLDHHKDPPKKDNRIIKI